MTANARRRRHLPMAVMVVPRPVLPRVPRRMANRANTRTMTKIARRRPRVTETAGRPRMVAVVVVVTAAVNLRKKEAKRLDNRHFKTRSPPRSPEGFFLF